MVKYSILVIAMFLLNMPLLGREKILINFDWKYKVGDHAKAELRDFNDTDWQHINLPHDASIYGPFVKDTLGGKANNGYRPRNIGWYRKFINIDQKHIGKKIYIEFEGVYRASDVWINGNHCGTFLNGYLDFQYDITNFLVEGKNLIAVRYDNTYQESSRWYTGEGINRNVYLHILEQVHVDRYGTYITTPKITDDIAKVVIETKVKNNLLEAINCKLVTNVVSPAGKVVASHTAVVPMNGNENYKFLQELMVPEPDVWDIEHPNLYKAVTYVYVNDLQSDVYTTNFGIREIGFTPEEGFLLNGRKVFIKGVCLHHDLGPLGAASFENAWDKRLTVLKNELGCNAIRLSHNPYPKYVLDWCDKNGILVFDEVYDKWNEQYYGPGNKFENHWKSDVETFIKRDRNHACVFIWSVGNEVMHQFTKQDPSNTFGVHQLKEMVDFVHTLEPSRKVTCSLYPARFNAIRYNHPKYKETEPAQMAFYTDVMSVNYMSQFFQKDRKKYPQLIFIIGEEMTSDDGIRFFNYNHSYVAGQFYWGGTEYIGESFGWPSKGWINGVIDLCNNLKSSGQSIKSFYNETPMVHIAVWDKIGDSLVWNDVKMTSKPKYPEWNRNAGDSLTVQVFSNCDQVELFINDVSQGVKTINRSRPEFIWEVTYEKGEVKAIGKNGGKVVAEHNIITPGDPYRIVLEADKEVMQANGHDLSYVTVKVVDKNNNLVTLANNKIDFEIKGAGTNAGVCNGNIKSNELWQANSRSVYKGECQLIVRATREKGKIEVKATSNGLIAAKCHIEAE